MGVKQRNFTCQTDLALISTIFICWGHNFTWSTTMYTKCFCIQLTNIQKCWDKIFVPRQSESGNTWSQPFLSRGFVDRLATDRKQKTEKRKQTDSSVYRIAPTTKKTHEFKQFSGHPQTGFCTRDLIKEWHQK